jgi:hypothetical protein
MGLCPMHNSFAAPLQPLVVSILTVVLQTTGLSLCGMTHRPVPRSAVDGTPSLLFTRHYPMILDRQGLIGRLGQPCRLVVATRTTA